MSIYLLSRPLSPAHPHHTRPFRRWTPRGKKDRSMPAHRRETRLFPAQDNPTQECWLRSTGRGRPQSLSYEASCVALLPTLPPSPPWSTQPTNLTCRRHHKGWALRKWLKNCWATYQLHQLRERSIFFNQDAHKPMSYMTNPHCRAAWC